MNRWAAGKLARCTVPCRRSTGLQSCALEAFKVSPHPNVLQAHLKSPVGVHRASTLLHPKPTDQAWRGRRSTAFVVGVEFSEGNRVHSSSQQPDCSALIDHTRLTGGTRSSVENWKGHAVSPLLKQIATKLVQALNTCLPMNASKR